MSLIGGNNGWIRIEERYPTREEYIKNDGRFIVTDGNRVYQLMYDIYEKKCFVEISCQELELFADKKVVAWQPMPEKLLIKEDKKEITEELSLSNLSDRNFIVELYNIIREVSTNLSHEKTFGKITKEDEGYQECLSDIGRRIRDYMHEDEDRFYIKRSKG